MLEDGDDYRSGIPRRSSDWARAWLPVILSIMSTLLALGILYGSLGGRLDLIEYRLKQIELRMP